MDNFDEEDIYRKFSKRLGDLGWFFLWWACGWLLLILASIGAAQVSLTLSSIWWRLILWFLMLLGCFVWNIVLPLYYAYTSTAVLAGLLIHSIEDYLIEKFPLKFTNKPILEGLGYALLERYL